MRKAIYVALMIVLLIAQIAVAAAEAEGNVMIGVATYYVRHLPYIVAVGPDKAIYMYRAISFAKIWPNGTVGSLL